MRIEPHTCVQRWWLWEFLPLGFVLCVSSLTEGTPVSFPPSRRVLRSLQEQHADSQGTRKCVEAPMSESTALAYGSFLDTGLPFCALALELSLHVVIGSTPDL